MRIKKIYQGNLPENKILNTESTSQTDTYSCEYINNLNTGGAGSSCNCREEVVLFESTSGTQSTITLSDSSANYEYIEIFYGNAQQTGNNSAKIHNPNGKGADLYTLASTGNNLYINTFRLSISGNTITPVNYGANRFQTSSYTVDTNTNLIYIYRVVGYK